MTRLLALFALAGVAHAHLLSMSSGEADLQGTRLTYKLSVPLYEITHISHPEEALFAHIEFANARLISHHCHAEPSRDSYFCTAEYTFPAPPDSLEVQCTFPEITVPNHVHLLRATHAGKQEQAVFDSAFTTATLRFRPPTATEVAARQVAGGATSALTGMLPLLVATLALAGTNWRNTAVLAAFFLAGQLAGALLNWQPAPRFLECAAALALAYVAVEVLFLPASPVRAAVSFCLGIVPGLTLAGFLRESESRLPFSFLGAGVAELAIFMAVAALAFRFPRLRRVPAALALTTGLLWFTLTLSR